MLGLFGWVALAAANCDSSSTSDQGGTGGVGAGAQQPTGSCEETLGFKLAACNLPPEASECSSPCLAQCMRAGSCDELEALFATGHPEGSLVSCFQGCAASSGDGSNGAGTPCNTDADCATDATCGPARTCVGEGSASNGSGVGGAGSDASGTGSGGSGGSGSGSESSGTSGGLTHPQCAAYANEICGTCRGANICGTGDCYSCAASTCDDIYDQCSAWLECQASTCGGPSCCGMPCSPC